MYVVIRLAIIFIELNFCLLDCIFYKGSIRRELLALFFHKMECLHFVCSRFAKKKVGAALVVFVRKYDFVYGCLKTPDASFLSGTLLNHMIFLFIGIYYGTYIFNVFKFVF